MPSIWVAHFKTVSSQKHSKSHYILFENHLTLIFFTTVFQKSSHPQSEGSNTSYFVPTALGTLLAFYIHFHEDNPTLQLLRRLTGWKGWEWAKLLCVSISTFCALGVPVRTLVLFWFPGLNAAITTDEVSHHHLLCPSKNVFCEKFHYLLPVLLLSIQQKQIWTKQILQKICEASYIHNTFHTVVSVLVDNRRQ